MTTRLNTIRRLPLPSCVLSFILCSQTPPAAKQESSQEYLSGADRALMVQSRPQRDALALYKANQDNFYYYIVGVSSYRERTGGPNADVPFVLSSAQLMKKALEDVGIKPLPSHTLESYCVQNCATFETVIDALDKLEPTPSGNTVFIFYSGHGFRSGRETQTDVKLAFSDQTASPDTSIALHDLLEHAKPSTQEMDGSARYRLVIFLDSCHAGAALKNAEQGNYLARNITLILAGADPEALSYQLNTIPETDEFGKRAGSISPLADHQSILPSAFGYYLARALTTDWGIATKNEGVLTLRRLLDYFDLKLKDNHPTDKPMEVSANTTSNLELLVRPDTATDSRSIYRQLITIGSLRGDPPEGDSAGLVIRFELGSSGSTEVPLKFLGGNSWDEFALPILVRDDKLKTVIAKLIRRPATPDAPTIIETVELKRDSGDRIGANADTLFLTESQGIKTMLFRGVFPKTRLSITLPIKLDEIPDVIHKTKPQKGTQCSPSDPTCIPSS
jgi:hypothetical protein